MESEVRDQLLERTNLLALFTIGFNRVEGIVSIWLGEADETLALFGFGVDSFIEVMSAVGVWHIRLRPGLPGKVQGILTLQPCRFASYLDRLLNRMERGERPV